MVICGIAGVLIAWVAALIIVNVPHGGLPLPVWAGIVVGATTGCLALIANLPLFSAIPATVVGYAMTFAYLVEAARVDNKVLLGVAPQNPLVCIIASIVIAAGFGIVSLKLATMLSTKAVAAAPAE